ncbi:PREDICTED: protein MENT [Colobus angolensis palliatus]|uniref:Protein MENT n=1 Tax=Colobus angolensis palliatus TaxID=336983 RepID=A0A2K5HC77_COLAP|nr:PREDICTED: protein MENT [Colobus angolensis palliatus]XP_011793227.1 PREDICTED: protein MENT [Colobus angolensis palliatus]
MVPAASALLWVLLLSLGPRAAGAQGLTQTPTAMQRISLRSAGPMTRSYRSTARPVLPRKTRIILEDDNDAMADADRLAGPAAAELLAATVSTGFSRSSTVNEEDGSSEEGVVINAGKDNTSRELPSATPSTAGSSSTRFIANSQEPEIRMTSSLPHSPGRSTEHPPGSEATLSQWSTPGSTPSRWPSPSSTAMPPPEDLRLVLMPWGPWHCHCKSGTMSRSRSGKLHGLSGRLRVGALSQLRTEHKPCTYQQCPCNRLREECPLDTSLCTDTNCASQSTTSTTRTTTTPFPTIHLRSSPSLPPTSPCPALAFWKQVRIGLEDIWNSLSSVFTEMQPIDRNRR